MDRPVNTGGPIPGNSRWSLIPYTSYTAPTSGHTFTVTSDAALTLAASVGCPVRWSTDTDANLRYGIFTGISGTTVTIAGPVFSGVVSQIWIGTPEQVVQADFVFNGLWAATLQSLIDNMNNSIFSWGFGTAYICKFSAWVKSGSGGTVMVTVNGINTAVASITPANIPAAPNSSVDIFAGVYKVVPDNTINVNCTTISSGSSTTLTVRILFVLA